MFITDKADIGLLQTWQCHYGGVDFFIFVLQQKLKGPQDDFSHSFGVTALPHNKSFAHDNRQSVLLTYITLLQNPFVNHPFQT